MPPKAKESKGKGMLNLKVPKGTKDWEGKDMIIRDKIFNTITSVFKRHGAVTIDTPYAGSYLFCRDKQRTSRKLTCDSTAYSSSAKFSLANTAKTQN